ncbi:hypothetical protein [Polaribacter atrinae]|uniref:hypothetical protein n=1 Tax=Polaribacter atrinae TaxID=1333662 RepID=UPI0030FB4E1A
MHTVEIPEANIKKYIPTDLSECKTLQYINVCNLLYKHAIGEIDLDTFKEQSIYFLADIKFKKKNVEDDEKYANVYLLAELMDSFFEIDEKGSKVIKQYFIHNPIEKIRGSFKNYYGPSDEFNNISFGEYVDALSHFYDYIETKDITFLYLLFATFYREKRSTFFSAGSFSKDKRVPYNSERVELLADKFKHQDMGVIYGFFMLFTSFQKYLTTAKIYVQGKEIDLNLLYREFPAGKKQPKSDLPGIGMKSLLYTIAESGIFGPLEKVRAASLWEILIRMYDIKKRDFDAMAANKTN